MAVTPSWLRDQILARHVISTGAVRRGLGLDRRGAVGARAHRRAARRRRRDRRRLGRRARVHRRGSAAENERKMGTTETERSVSSDKITPVFVAEVERRTTPRSLFIRNHATKRRHRDRRAARRVRRRSTPPRRDDAAPRHPPLTPPPRRRVRSCVLFPRALAETAPTRLRGALGAVNQLGVTYASRVVSSSALSSSSSSHFEMVGRSVLLVRARRWRRRREAPASSGVASRHGLRHTQQRTRCRPPH